MTLRIHLFGSMRCEVDGAPLRLPPRAKLISAWAYLLLHPDHPVPRATLAFTIWPDHPEREARASLRRGLHRIQSMLPPPPGDRPWLLLDGDLVGWNPAADAWIDVRAFDALLADEGGLEEAVALYRDDLLQDLYDDWVLPERDRWRERLLTCLARLVDRHRQLGRFPQAITYAERLLALEPLREDAVRRLMAARYQSGDRAGSLQVHARFVQQLADELDSEPMPETTALFEAILRHGPLPGDASPPESSGVPAPTRGPSQPATTARPMVPFVGRPSERAQLEALWSRAARGQGTIVLISGDAGIGKSRLAGELAVLAEAQGGRVLLGSTTPGEPIPYQSFIAALRAGLPLLRSETMSPLTLSALAALIPEIGAERPDLPALAPLDVSRERTRLFRSQLDALSTLARTRPLLLLLEDLHWAGAPTVDLLEFLAASLQRLPLLLVATYRSDQTPRDHPLRRLRRGLQRTGQLTQVTLGPLDRVGVGEMLRLLGITGAPLDVLADRLHAESEGNPFFLLERLRDLEEGGALRRAGGEWEIGDMPSSPPPTSVQEAIISRLGRLSAPARTMLDTASVIGLAFDLELVAEVSGWTEPQAQAGLQELLDHQLIRELAGQGFDFGFSHHLVQETAYDRLAEAPRRRRHLRAAKVLEDLAGDRLDEWAGTIAAHCDHGGEPTRGARFHALAAGRAARVFADGDALEHLEAALARTDEAASRFGLLSLREQIFARRGDRDRQRADLNELELLAELLEDPSKTCEVLLRWTRFERLLGNRAAEAERVAALERNAGSLQDPLWIARAGQAKAGSYIATSQYDPARAELERALAVYRQLADGPGQVESLCMLAEIAIQQGYLDRVDILLEQAGAIPAALASQQLLIQTMRAASAAAFTRQKFQVSLSMGAEMLTLAEAIGDEEGKADAHLRLGTAHARLFQVDAARGHYREAARGYRLLGRRQGQGAVLINAGFLANWLGQYAEARSDFHAAETIFQELEDVRGQAISALNLGMVAFYQGDHAAARQAAKRGLAFAGQMGSQVMEANALANLGAAERELGELDLAVEHMQAGIELRRKVGQPAELAVDLCDLAAALLRRGDLAPARHATEEMRALHDAAPDSMMYPQHILWVAAQTALASDDLRRATDLFGRAVATLEAKAAAIPEADSRAAFLELPFNRQIRDAASSNWPPESV